MKEFLGVDVPDDAHGVLQDVHWSGGGIGYFPTYALGNVISLQIWAKVREALPDLDDQLAAGDLLPAVRVAARQPLLARPQAHAEGDARAADRLGRDRPAAVPRVPPRQGRRARGLDGDARRAEQDAIRRRPRRPRAGGRRHARARARRRRPSRCSPPAAGRSTRTPSRGTSSRRSALLSDRVSLSVVEHDEPGPWPRTTIGARARVPRACRRGTS